MRTVTLLLDRDVQQEYHSEHMLTAGDHLILLIFLRVQKDFCDLQEFHLRPAQRVQAYRMRRNPLSHMSRLQLPSKF